MDFSHTTTPTKNSLFFFIIRLRISGRCVSLTTSSMIHFRPKFEQLSSMSWAYHQVFWQLSKALDTPPEITIFWNGWSELMKALLCLLSALDACILSAKISFVSRNIINRSSGEFEFDTARSFVLRKFLFCYSRRLLYLLNDSGFFL